MFLNSSFFLEFIDYPICSPCSGIRTFEVLNVRYVCWFSMMERSWKSSILKIVKKDSVIPIRSKDGSEMEIVFIFKFNQPNQPIIFYNIQFKFILSFYAYDEIGFRIAFLPRSSVHLPSNDGRLSAIWFQRIECMMTSDPRKIQFRLVNLVMNVFSQSVKKWIVYPTIQLSKVGLSGLWLSYDFYD